MSTPTEYRDLDPASFAGTVASSHRPAILRGFVRHWPAVHKAQHSPEALLRNARPKPAK